MYTRRHFGKLALAALPVSGAMAKISSKIHGVQIGVATFSYTPLPRQGLLDAIIQSMVDCGIGDCLLNPPPTEPVDLLEKARPVRGGGGGGQAAAAAPRAVAQEEAAVVRLPVPSRRQPWRRSISGI